MPKVGSKKFPYTPTGEAAAAKTAKATGQPLQMQKGKRPNPFGRGSDKKK